MSSTLSLLSLLSLYRFPIGGQEPNWIAETKRAPHARCGSAWGLTARTSSAPVLCWIAHSFFSDGFDDDPLKAVYTLTPMV